MLDSRIVNQREVRVVGMSRSGNHSIIHWILEQSEGIHCFLNCVEPRTNPFETARVMGDGHRALCNDPQFDIEAEATGRHIDKDLLLYSYEDCFLTTVCHREFEQAKSRYVGGSARRQDVLILRDPYNLFASRLRSRFGGVTPKTAIRIWKQHARQYLGQRQHFTEESILVNFNRWSEEEAYRCQIAERLQLDFTDAGFDTIPKTGGGSSFSRRLFNGKANRMNVLGRWRHFQDDEEFCSLLDQEVVELSDQIFGPIEKTKAFARFVQRLSARPRRVRPGQC